MYRRTDIVADLLRLKRIAIGNRYHELVTAVPTRYRAWRQTFSQDMADCSHCVSASEVSMAVIQSFQPVDIQHQQRE